MPVPLLDVNAQNHPLESELQAAFNQVLKHGRFIMGPEMEAFEKEVAAMVGVKHALSVFWHGCLAAGAHGSEYQAW
jgi:dTDP-4-amino-4,6-dideoxygalactose transaminase